MMELSILLNDFVHTDKSKELLSKYVENTNLSDEDKIRLNKSLTTNLSRHNNIPAPKMDTKSIEISEPNNKNTPQEHSFVAGVKALLEDLGIGFGWAAVYFTILTSSFNGKTIGKRLMKLTVKKLDGSKITYWDSFTRYGGYAAGFSTGLLGFIQIYWDPNRQAIQDKIATTLVIDLAKPAKSNLTEHNTAV